MNTQTSIARVGLRPPNRIRNNELVRDAAIRTLSHFGLEGTNFNSISLDASLSNSVLRKRFSNIDELLVDVWQSRCISGFMAPINMTILSYLLSEPSADHEKSRELLNNLFNLSEVECAALEILAATASHDFVCEAISTDIKAHFANPILVSQTAKAQYVFYFQFILGVLFHYRGQVIDRELLVDHLHKLLVNGIEPAEASTIPEVDASFIRGSYVLPEQTPHHDLMNACLTCVAENGFSATTTKMIAKTALVSEGKLFAYFPTKLDLFLEAMSHQIENGFATNFKEISKWNEQFGAGISAAILIREYQREGIDIERAVQVEFLRLAWHRPDMFEKRLQHVNKALIEIGVASIEKISPEQDVEMLLSVASTSGAIIVARLDRDAYKLPYAVVTQKIFGI